MTDQEQGFWTSFCEQAQLQFSPNLYQYMVADVTFLGVRDNLAHIQGRSEQMQYWKMDKTINAILIAVGFEYFDQEIKLKLIEKNQDEQSDDVEFADPTVQPIIIEEELASFPVQSNLSQSYRFDNFVQGDNNKFSMAASLVVANKPGKPYNPLFIWGGPGLGKTHLLNAIGNMALETNPNYRIKYVTTEEFVNEFVASIRTKKTNELKERYRNLDYLLIDDVQSLAGKVETQEEFFNTFDALLKHNKQIVITSDRPPTQLDGVEQRLVTRFSWGTSTNITPPEYETRFAIIQSKVENSHLTFSHEAIEYLSNQFTSNIREIEGAINNIGLVAMTRNTTEVTIDLIAEALASIKPDQFQLKPSVISISHIQEEVGKFYGVAVKDIRGIKRVQNIAFARQVAIYLSRELTDFSTIKIGKEFGNRDHSTILHSYNKIDDMVKQDAKLKLDIDNLIKKLK